MCYDLFVPAPVGGQVSCVLLWSAFTQGAFFMPRRNGGWWSAWYTACTFRRVPA